MSTEKCPNCRAAMRVTRGKVPYECGVAGITLDGVKVLRCPKCGEREVEIEQTERLHRSIAVQVARRPGRLGPDEVRFLRKELGLSGTDFAAVVGVDKSTVSRWESRSDPAPMSPQSERLLRVLVLSGKSVRSYGLEEIGREAPAPAGLLFAHDSGGWRAAG